MGNDHIPKCRINSKEDNLSTVDKHLVPMCPLFRGYTVVRMYLPKLFTVHCYFCLSEITISKFLMKCRNNMISE